jgi:hypothetical protein
MHAKFTGQMFKQIRCGPLKIYSKCCQVVEHAFIIGAFGHELRLVDEVASRAVRRRARPVMPRRPGGRAAAARGPVSDCVQAVPLLHFRIFSCLPR